MIAPSVIGVISVIIPILVYVSNVVKKVKATKEKPIVQRNVKIALIVTFSIVAVCIVMLILEGVLELTNYGFLYCICPIFAGLIIIIIPISIYLHNVRMRIKTKEDEEYGIIGKQSSE